MTYKLSINNTIRTLEYRKMTKFVGAAVALGVTYACVAPWFYCNSNTPEEESHDCNNKESNADVSSANQTLTSTNIRITGLRGLNFISVTLPKQHSSSKVSGNSLEASSNVRTSYQPLSNNKVSKKKPFITRQDIIQRSTVPEIHISSVSTETTVYPLSSNASLHSFVPAESSTIHRGTLIDSNSSRCDVIRSHDVNDKNLVVRRMSQPRIRKPPRAHPPNSRLSPNLIIRNQDSLSSLNTFEGGEMNNVLRSSSFIERKNVEDNISQLSDTVNETSSPDLMHRHSLYPNVNIINRTNDSTATLPLGSNINHSIDNLIDRQDLISECSKSGEIIMQSHSLLNKNYPTVIDNSERISDKLQNKSVLSKFFRKKCKKFWIHMNRNNYENSMKSKCPIGLMEKNKPTGHSTFIEMPNVSGVVQGHLNGFRCESEMVQERLGDYHNKNLNINSKSNMYKRDFIIRGISCCNTPNLHETAQTINTTTSSNISSHVEINNHKSLPCNIKFDCIDEQPLDLSIKSKVNQINDNNDEKNDNNNFTSQSSFIITLRKRTNFIISKTFNRKLITGKKCRSLPEKNEMNIINNISYFCHRSQRDKDEEIKIDLNDSTQYPELKSINGKCIYLSGFSSH